MGKWINKDNSMAWKRIETQSDADELMKIFGDFHDSCLKEAHLWTDSHVGADLRMSCPVHLDHRVRVLIQRQFKNPSAIELLFEEVTRFNLVPEDEGYCLIISNATLIIRDGVIYWSPYGAWKPEDLDRDEVTWISARKLSWREIDWMDAELRYGPGKE